MTISDVLNKAADLIEPRGRWTQGHYARTKSGDICSSYDRSAVSWCAIGAIMRIGGKGDVAWDAEGRLEAFTGGESVGMWNDKSSRRKRDVIAALREAAKLAQEQGL